MLLQSVLLGDRSVLELLNAKYTFVNERLASHYGIPGVYGDQFRRVEVNDGIRGGLLGQGSILTATSYPTRTSPVLARKMDSRSTPWQSSSASAARCSRLAGSG